MSIRYFSTPYNYTTTADLRTFGAALNLNLTQAGLVQTADTGQINWNTVVAVGANATVGYEVWRFSDALQGVLPVFLKFTFRTGGNSEPQIQILVGTGSDGVGNLTGSTGTSEADPTHNVFDAPGVVTNHIVSVGDGFLVMAFSLPPDGSNPNRFALTIVERVRDTGGLAQPDGVYVSRTAFHISSGYPITNHAFHRAAVGGGSYNATFTLTDHRFANLGWSNPFVSTQSGRMWFSPVYPFAGGAGSNILRLPPLTCIVFTAATQVNSGETIPVRMYGSNRQMAVTTADARGMTGTPTPIGTDGFAGLLINTGV